ncbi:MAG: hypothetical protein J6I85_06175 [Clostridia bacterium]|nr:hypothetical protein [Clostridia bacterium]
MFRTEDLLKLIESEDPQLVADNFATALNEAIKIKNEKDAKAKLEKAKRNDAKALENMIVDYVKKYYPDLAGDIEVFDDTNIHIFTGAIDDLCNEIRKITIKSNLNSKNNDPIGEFLRKNGL